MTKTVLPLDQKLVENLSNARKQLAIAKEVVEQAESAIYLAVEKLLPEKGTTHFEGVKIVTKFYDKWDSSKLDEIEKEWSQKSNLPWPFKKEWKAEGKSITYLRENAPDNYNLISDALTLTPAKPSFTLAGEKE